MITAKPSSFIDGGLPVTYRGTPHACTYWEVVGVDGLDEVEPSGRLARPMVLADVDGFAVNHYIASGVPTDVGKIDRLKVYEKAP